MTLGNVATEAVVSSDVNEHIQRLQFEEVSPALSYSAKKGTKFVRPSPVFSRPRSSKSSPTSTFMSG